MRFIDRVTRRRCVLAIMDGTNLDVINDIVQRVAEWTDTNYEDIRMHSYDDDCSSMRVLEYEANEFWNGFAQDDISERYPGLCMFNPPMAV